MLSVFGLHISYLDVAASSHHRKVQVLQSVCSCVPNIALWYFVNRQIHEDFGVPVFADDITALTERFDSDLADVYN
jgi:hypothetical protein